MTSRSRIIRRGLFALGVACFAVAVWDLTRGGFYFRFMGLRVSSWEAFKPFRYGVAAIVAALWLHDREVEPRLTSWNRLPEAAPLVVGAISIALIAIAIHFGVFVAGGADAYGYVSQAHLWASGRLEAPDRLAALAPDLGPAVAPLGYELARRPGALAPIYSPGLPLIMAVALRLVGPSGVYLVVPLLAGLTVWLTYALARQEYDRRVGLVAAILVAFSPIVLFQSLLPMSDVPATACWMTAWVLAVSPGRWSPLGAGLAVSMAILTRPNLVALTVVLLPVVAGGVSTRPSTGPGLRMRRLAWFVVGVAPGCLAVAALNHYLHGASLRSGYGPLETLYAWNRSGDNLRRYGSWLVELNSPGILLALAAPFGGGAKKALSMLAFSAVVLGSYLFYFVFDSWPFLRFLLPAIPLMFILSSQVVVRLIERAPLAWRGSAVCLLCTLVPCWYLVRARELTVFALQRAEQRYVAVGQEIGRALEPNAVIVTVIQSGSIRLYGDRATLRWDAMDPVTFDAAMTTVQARGYVPYLLLEDWEEPPFRDRFAGRSIYGSVDWPPMLEYSGAMKVRIYSLADRARYLRREQVVTRRFVRGPISGSAAVVPIRPAGN